MPKLETPLLVHLDGRPEPIRVTSDQRDLARWEASPARDETAVHTRSRFVAWSALARSGEYTGGWKTFNERDCLEVESLYVAGDDQDDAEDEQGLDPGRPTRSATD
jgi:hypothetical protein